MPYIISKQGNNKFKVCKKDNPSKCFSNNPLTLENARAQLKAIGLNSHLKGGNNIEILNKLKKIKGLYLVGSANRNEDFNDLDFVTEYNLNDIIENIKKYYDVSIIKNGIKFKQLKINNINIDIWKVNNKDELKSIKILRTLDKGHYIGFKKLAKNKNYLLNDKGLFDENNNRIIFNNKIELKKILE